MTHVASIAWWKILDGEMPYWRVAEHINITYPKGLTPVIQEVIEPTIHVNFEWIGGILLALFVTGLFCSIFVEWLNSPKGFERLVDPLARKVERRYEFVIERSRLASMNGHP